MGDDRRESAPSDDRAPPLGLAPSGLPAAIKTPPPALPPRGSGEGAAAKSAIQDAERDAQASGETVDRWKVGQFRRVSGYVLGVLTSVAAGTFFVWSLIALDALKDPPEALRWFSLAKIVGHAVITFAALYFCYQLLRVAERLILPHWWLKDHRRLVVTMLGANDPIIGLSQLMKQLKLLMKALGAPPLLKLLGEPPEEKKR